MSSSQPGKNGGEKEPQAQSTAPETARSGEETPHTGKSHCGRVTGAWATKGHGEQWDQSHREQPG